MVFKIAQKNNELQYGSYIVLTLFFYFLFISFCKHFKPTHDLPEDKENTTLSNIAFIIHYNKREIVYFTCISN